MSVRFKEGAVCFADGKQIYTGSNTINGYPLTYCSDYELTINKKDFQLNTPAKGWYIHKSEIDTEQKYNDVVEVFGLFGFNCNYVGYGAGEVMFIDSERDLDQFRYDEELCRTKCTYNQLMVIGKLKRMIDEKEDNLPHKLLNTSLLKDEIASEEWKPTVGEEVEAVFGEINSMRGELLALTKEYAIIQQEGYEQHLHLKGWTLRNPKSKEDILIEEIAELFVKPMKISEEGVRSPKDLSKDLIRLLSKSGYKIIKEDEI